jgi:hypothetical protein
VFNSVVVDFVTTQSGNFWIHPRKFRVSENAVLRRIFGPKREELAGGWRRLHNEELHNYYASPNIISVIS